MSLTPQQLADALAVAARDTYRPPPPWMFSSLLRPYTPPEPPPRPTTEIVCPDPDEAPAAPPVAEMVATPATRSEVATTWQALLDVTVWRSRPWWLRASLVVRRLGR